LQSDREKDSQAWRLPVDTRLSARASLARPWLGAAAVSVLTVVILGALQVLTRELSYAGLIAAARATPALDLLRALLATALSYGALIGYDVAALRYAGARVAGPIIAMTSWVAFSLGNTIGLGALSGATVRLRLYSAAGVAPERVEHAIRFGAVSFGIGIATIAAICCAWAAPALAAVLPVVVAVSAIRGLCLAILIVCVLILALCANRDAIGLFGKYRIPLPPLGLALLQLGLCAVDVVAMAAALWWLLPAIDLPFMVFMALFLLALIAGIVSRVPGGIGVFEAVMLLTMGQVAPLAEFAAALILFRGIYFLLPLLFATGTLSALELRVQRIAPALAAAVDLVPLFLGALTAVAGTLLLVSGATPDTDEATVVLSTNLPLALVETSHFLGSLAGIPLLVVAHGLLHRLDAAWWAAVLITGFSIVLALPKGLAIGELTFFSALLVMLALSRQAFSRRASLFSQPLSRDWLLAIGVIMVSCTWLLFFAYRDVAYANSLWWLFAFDGNAPRSLRALTAAAAAAFALALWQLLRRDPGRAQVPDPLNIDKAAAIVDQLPIADAGLVLLGDKSLLFSASGRAFVMYGKQGRSWIALHDPVGAPEEQQELIWRFIEMANAHGGRAAFYQARPAMLPTYLDAGLRVYKLGEYATVLLPGFDLHGKRWLRLRQSCNRVEREGVTFEVLPAGAFDPLLPELRAVSDQWLTSHQAREKRFSLGAFNWDYLRRCPIALIRHQGRIVAFANMLVTQAQVEVTVDLMRHIPDAPRGSMDYLFTQLLLHYRDAGFQRFGLGMAPMSGMLNHPLASRWHRIGRLLFTHGERFYNFQGLRSFKEKFDPVWEPRYLIAPGGLAALLTLTDTAALIAGGIRGVVTK